MGGRSPNKQNSIPIKAGAAVVLLVLAVVCGVVFWNRAPRLPEERAETLPVGEEQVIRLDPQTTTDQTLAPATILDGSVLDETGRGYASANVSVKPAADTEALERNVTTDSYGRFRCQLPAGRFVFSATAADAIAAATNQHTTGPDGVSDPILRLPRARSLAGMVVNASSEPIPKARITLYAKKNFDAVTVAAADPAIAAVSYAAVADAFGAFRFPAIWPGAYLLRANAEGYLEHAQAGVPADLQEKQIVLRREASLLVRVVDDAAAPVFLASVQLRRSGGAETRIESKETTKSGEVHFLSLSPGGHEVSAAHTDYALTGTSSAEIEINRDFQETTLVLKHKGYKVSGRVLDAETREPVAGFPLAVLPPTWFSYDVIRSATSDARGFFCFDDVPRGKYRIGQIHEIHRAHPYMFLSGRNAVNPVAVGDADVEGIQLLAYKGPHVTGHVYDRHGKPVSRAYVGFTRGWTLTDENGVYEAYLGLIKYSTQKEIHDRKRLHASHPSHGSGESELFEYRPGDRIEGIDIVLDQSVRIVGQVTDKAGKPIPDAEVDYRIFTLAVYKKLLHLEDKMVFPVDAQGRFEIPNAPLRPGDDVRLTVKAPEYQTEKRKRCYLAGHITKAQKRQKMHENPVWVWLKGKKTVTEDFQLAGKDEEKEKTSQIRGIVVDRNGAPMGDLLVWCKSMDNDIHRPQGGSATKTESGGSFSFENLKEETRYYLVAQMERPPYLEKEAYPVLVGAEDVVIRLDFEPVELTVQVDDSRLKPDHEKLMFWIRLMSVDRPELPAMRELCDKEKSDPNPIKRSFLLKSPGVYQVHTFGGGGEARERFTIDRDTPKQPTIRLIPETISRDEGYLLFGSCVNADGKPAAEEFRGRVRRLDAPDFPPFYVERRSITVPRFGNHFYVVLKEEGLFEVVYMKMDGTVFHRSLVPLSRSQGTIWEEQGEEAMVIVLPEVVYPADQES